jgi:hypothetical protein
MTSCKLPSVLCSSNKSKSTKGDASVSFSSQESMDFSISAQGPKEAIMLKPTNHNGSIDVTYSDSTIPGKKLELTLYKILIINNSLHTYCTLGKDDRADGELLMYYKGDGRYLIVCIPVMFSSPTTMFPHSKGNTMSKQGSQNVKKMIQMAPMKTKRGEQTIVSGLNLNSLFPHNKPFYHEQQPSDDGDQCFGINSGAIMIIYDKNDIHVLLDKQIEKEFNSKTIPSKSDDNKDSLFVKSKNKKGSKLTSSFLTRKTTEGFENNNDSDDSDNEDDDNSDNNDDNSDNEIYIDCRPTGSDGKALYEEDLSLFKPSLNMGSFKKLEKTFSFIDKIKNSPAFYLIIGLLIAVIIVKFGGKAIAKARGFLQKRTARKLAQ